MRAPRGYWAAAGLIMLALMCFTALDATAKHLSERHPVPLIVWVRYTVHFVLMTALLAPRMGWALVRTEHPKLQVVRGLALWLTTACVMAALSTLPLAETLALAFLSPLLVVLLAKPLLGEQPSRFIWLATAMGFGGLLLIVRPGGAVAGPGVLFALATAVMYASYQLLTRKLSHVETPTTLLYYTALMGTVGASFMVPFYWSSAWPDAHDTLLFATLGLWGGGGHFLLIRAFSRAPASSLSPLFYVQLIWQTLAGYLVFNHLPDAYAVTGGLVIVASGLIVLWSQRTRPR